MMRKREVYEVIHPQWDKKALYRTRRGALGRIAWWKVFGKYQGIEDVFTQAAIDGTDTRIKHPKCTCGPEQPQLVWIDETQDENCPIHNRETGYLKRLHDRFVKFHMAASEDN